MGATISKHSHPRLIEAFLADPAQNDTHVMFMVRDPFSNLASDKDHPYQMRECFEKDLWLTSVCLCADIEGPDPLCPEEQSAYSSIVELYDTFATGHASLAQTANGIGRSGSASLIHYEDLVLEPVITLEKIANALGAQDSDWRDKIVEVMEANVANGVGLARENAIEKIKSRSFLEVYSETMQHYLCDHVTSM